MSIDVTYRCGGCDAVAEVRRIRQTFAPVSSVLTAVRTPTFESAAPEGWVAFDPYTGVCYCPDCWADIDSPQEASE